MPPDSSPCQLTVCSIDSYCCATAWDGLCNQWAQSLCTCCPGQSPGSCVISACNCCTGGDGEGCNCPPCEETVCAVDAFCCAVAWNGACDAAAAALCTCCAGQSPGFCFDGGIGGLGCNCCAGGNGVGCDCAPCAAEVCLADWFCCQVAWDSICAARAEVQCDCCPGQVPGECF